MTQGQGSAVWHLCRDDEQTGPLSERELYMLAELGHLRPGDLLWRPGFSDWKPAESVPGLLTPPPPPPKAGSSQKKKAKKKRDATGDTPPPLPRQHQSVFSDTDTPDDLPEAPSVLSDDVPQFLVGLVSKPAVQVKSGGDVDGKTKPATSEANKPSNDKSTTHKASAGPASTNPTKPSSSNSSTRSTVAADAAASMRELMVVAKDRLKSVEIGSKLGDLGASIAALPSQDIVRRMKRPRVLMGVVGGLLFLGVLNVIAKPFLGDEEYALRGSPLADNADGTEAGRSSKFQDRYADSDSSRDGPPRILSDRSARENGGPPTGSIDLDPEFLRPKTVPRPGAAERAAAEASDKSTRDPASQDAEAASKPDEGKSSPSKPDSTKTAMNSPSKPDSTKTAMNSPSRPGSPTAASGPPAKSISPVFAPRAPGPSKTVINVATPKGIRLVQMRLNELGYLSMQPNGVWTSETTKALEAFTAKAKLGEYQNWNSAVERALFANEAPRQTASADPRR